jgi:Rrf2 family protein
MKFSTRTTYGLRAMIVLARAYKNKQGALSLPQIAQAEELSQGYLERIFAQLKKNKLVIAEKGKSGGYVLVRDPKKIEVLSVVEALEGDLNPFHCVLENGKINCSKKCNCGANSVLIKVQASIIKTLKEISLNDLI